MGVSSEPVAEQHVAHRHDEEGEAGGHEHDVEHGKTYTVGALPSQVQHRNAIGPRRPGHRNPIGAT
jgi:hypothetical protein